MSKKRLDFDEEDEDLLQGKTLGFYVNSFTVNSFTVHLNQPVAEPSYYTGVANMLYKASEHDTVAFMINSPGGLYSGLQTLLDAIMSTQARTIAFLVGECSSAASILALHCDMVDVGPLASMLCHNVRYGYSGKGSDVLSHVEHVTKTSEKLMRNTYQHFLSEEEINDVLSGKELYLDSDEIAERLEKREQILNAPEDLDESELEIAIEGLENEVQALTKKVAVKKAPKKK